MCILALEGFFELPVEEMRFRVCIGFVFSALTVFAIGKRKTVFG
jgi:hypothetical protein